MNKLQAAAEPLLDFAKAHGKLTAVVIALVFGLILGAALFR